MGQQPASGAGSALLPQQGAPPMASSGGGGFGNILGFAGSGQPLTDKERLFLGALEGATRGGDIYRQDGYAIYGGNAPANMMGTMRKVYGDIDAERRAEKKREKERKERMEDQIKMFEMQEGAAEKRATRDANIRASQSAANQLFELNKMGRAEDLAASNRVLSNYQKQLDRGLRERELGQRERLMEEELGMKREDAIAKRLTAPLEAAQKHRNFDAELRQKAQTADLMYGDRKMEREALAATNKGLDAELAGIDKDFGASQKRLSELRNLIGPMRTAERQAESAAEAEANILKAKPSRTGDGKVFNEKFEVFIRDLTAKDAKIAEEMFARDPSLTKNQILVRLGYEPDETDESFSGTSQSGTGSQGGAGTPSPKPVGGKFDTSYFTKP